MKQPIEREVHELHRFFQAWFRGDLPKTREAFESFQGAMGPQFCMVPPGGRLISREELCEQLWGAHGADPTCEIWIENVSVRELGGKLQLVVYEEWQDRGDERRGRVSSAVLAAEEEAPRGLVWLHLQETWMPPDTPSNR